MCGVCTGTDAAVEGVAVVAVIEMASTRRPREAGAGAWGADGDERGRQAEGGRRC